MLFWFSGGQDLGLYCSLNVFMVNHYLVVVANFCF